MRRDTDTRLNPGGQLLVRADKKKDDVVRAVAARVRVNLATTDLGRIKALAIKISTSAVGERSDFSALCALV